MKLPKGCRKRTGDEIHKIIYYTATEGFVLRHGGSFLARWAKRNLSYCAVLLFD